MTSQALWSIAGAIAACAWLAGLWYAAPLLDRDERDTADRLRNAIVLGVAIPFVLGFLGVLWAATAFAVLAAACGARRRWRPRSAAALPPDRALLAILASCALFAWPQLVHPVLDGDSLGYHLPNAASWAQSHSIWQSNAREWFYPGASELFAAPLFAGGARWSLALCGTPPALLLLARVTIWGRQLGLRTLEAGLCAAALVATPIAAYEVGTLQNDLWLAAFFVETLYVLRSRAGPLVFALTALLKPVGFIYAAIALAVDRRFDARMLLGLVPPALWLVRDAVLLPHAAVPVEPGPDYWSTSIAGNVGQTAALLGRGLGYAGFAVPLLVVLPFAGLALREVRAVAAGGSVAAVLFVFLPYSFAGSVNFIAAGTSLRFALPAMACGAVVLCALAVRFRLPSLLLAALVTIAGSIAVLTAFWSDGWSGPAAIGVAAACIAAASFERSSRRLAAPAAALVLIAAAPLAATRAPGFFGDWMRAPDGAPTHAFDWVAAQRPARIAMWSVRSGSVLLVSPRTRVVEASETSPCQTALDAGALLFAGTDRDLPPGEQVRRRSVALACGEPVYTDAAAVIVRPR